jgi:L-ascorbate metabolism protein UlaG (beta-lactamase superfamily)
VGDRLTFLGHSTVLVHLDGVRVLMDPVLGAPAVYRQLKSRQAQLRGAHAD